MHLEEIHLLNMKNHADLHVSFLPGINCVVGNNATGKTSLLEAVHYLCLTKSFANQADLQNIRHDDPFMMIEGKFDRQNSEEHLQLSLKRGQKKSLRRNKKEYEKLADHIGLFPCVVISPLDYILVTGGSDERRKFLDSLISQFDRNYLDTLIAYRRVIDQRNALLKKFWEDRRYDEDTLGIYNDQMLEFGKPVIRKRQQFLDEFIPVFGRIYSKIVMSSEQVDIVYESGISAHGSLEEAIRQSAERDRHALYTTEGPHREDLNFVLDGKPIKKFGSQGQQKSFLVALKLAEHHYLQQKMQMSPVLLLDDISDKLDVNRVKQLLQMVSAENFGQVIITDTGKQKISEILDKTGIHVNFIEFHAKA